MIRMGNSNPEERCAFLLVNSGTQSLLCQLKQCQTFPPESWDLNEHVDPNSPQNCSEMHDLMKTFFKLKNFQFRPQSFKQQSFKSYISTCSFKRTFLIWHVFSGVCKEFQPVSCAEDIRLHHQRDALSSALAGHLVRHRWKFTSKTYANSLVDKDPL